MDDQTQAINDYQKLGGWFLLFVLYYLIGVVFSLYNIISTTHTAAANLVTGSGLVPASIDALISQGLIFISVVFVFVFVVQVWERKPLFLLFMQMSFLVSFLSALFSYGISRLFGEGFGFASPALPVLLLSLTLTVSAFLLVTFYFCNSVRVRVYMGSDEYMDKAILALRQKPFDSNISAGR